VNYLPAGEPQRGEMESLSEKSSSSVGIACGFFEFASRISKLIISLLPDYIVLRRNDPALARVRRDCAISDSPGSRW
jgi:hypothetical protein